jgi:hypothetical protein
MQDPPESCDSRSRSRTNVFFCARRSISLKENPSISINFYVESITDSYILYEILFLSCHM